MKVILRSDVENLGHLGDIVEVKAGYGRNFLLPQALAMLASPSNLKNFELERKKLQAKMDSVRADANTIADKLANFELTIAMRVGENEKLYGSVTSSLIAEYLEKAGFEVDRRRILIDHTIRALGTYLVRIRLHADVCPEIKLYVVSEERKHSDEPSTKKEQE